MKTSVKEAGSSKISKGLMIAGSSVLMALLVAANVVAFAGIL